MSCQHAQWAASSVVDAPSLKCNVDFAARDRMHGVRLRMQWFNLCDVQS